MHLLYNNIELLTVKFTVVILYACKIYLNKSDQRQHEILLKKNLIVLLRSVYNSDIK